jgi:glutathione S-transferase
VTANAGYVLTQSLAIIVPGGGVSKTPRLLPSDPAGRAIVRAMSLAIATDVHPLNNLRVLDYEVAIGQSQRRSTCGIATGSARASRRSKSSCVSILAVAGIVSEMA